MNGIDGVVGGVPNNLFGYDMVDGFVDGYRGSRSSVGVCETVGEKGVNRWNRSVLKGVFTWPCWCWEMRVEVKGEIMRILSQRVEGRR